MRGDMVMDESVLARLAELGGPDFVREMIDLFLDQAPRGIARLLVAERDGDLEGIRRAAHSLISTAGNLGVKELAAVATALEQAAIRGDWDEARGLLAEVKPAFARAREQLDAAKAARAL
jgi:HPt (histidine-containing phosphotransfer) domain-containing protein